LHASAYPLKQNNGDDPECFHYFKIRRLVTLTEGLCSSDSSFWFYVNIVCLTFSGKKTCSRRQAVSPRSYPASQHVYWVFGHCLVDTPNIYLRETQTLCWFKVVCSPTSVLLCFINLILGNRYSPGVSSCQQTSDAHLRWPDHHPPSELRRWLYRSPHGFAKSTWIMSGEVLLFNGFSSNPDEEREETCRTLISQAWTYVLLVAVDFLWIQMRRRQDLLWKECPAAGQDFSKKKPRSPDLFDWILMSSLFVELHMPTLAFTTWNSDLIPLIESLYSSNPYRFEFSVFGPLEWCRSCTYPTFTTLQWCLNLDVSPRCFLYVV